MALALLTFNLGIEAGQLLFVAAIFLAARALSAVVAIPFGPVRMMASYMIGTMSMLWLITRIESFWS